MNAGTPRRARPGRHPAHRRGWRRAGSTLPSLAPDLGDRIVRLGDGRRVATREFGLQAGLPLIALHGTPGSRLKFLAADSAARAAGIRVIAPDRWGYGATDHNPEPSLAAFARDTIALADRLGLARFAVLGVSGGGPYAAAVAAEAPARVAALALAAPVGPIHGEDDAEISRFHRLCFGALAQRPAAVGAVFRTLRTVLGVAPDIGMRVAMLRVAATDRRALRHGDTAMRLGETFVEGLKPGVAGPVTDLALFGAPWNIDLARASVPARLWLGTADQNVPRSAARRLADRLPACELVELPGEGHLWIAQNYATVLGWISQAASDSPRAPSA